MTMVTLLACSGKLIEQHVLQDACPVSQHVKYSSKMHRAGWQDEGMQDCYMESEQDIAQQSCSSVMKRLASLSERSLCARPEHVLIACSWPGVILDVKNTCAVRYCGFVFQSFSNSCTLLSEGVMKYTPETESKGSLFFSRFSTTAAHWMHLLYIPRANVADVTGRAIANQSDVSGRGDSHEMP